MNSIRYIHVRYYPTHRFHTYKHLKSKQYPQETNTAVMTKSQYIPRVFTLREGGQGKKNMRSTYAPPLQPDSAGLAVACKVLVFLYAGPSTPSGEGGYHHQTCHLSVQNTAVAFSSLRKTRRSGSCKIRTSLHATGRQRVTACALARQALKISDVCPCTYL